MSSRITSVVVRRYDLWMNRMAAYHAATASNRSRTEFGAFEHATLFQAHLFDVSSASSFVFTLEWKPNVSKSFKIETFFLISGVSRVDFPKERKLLPHLRNANRF